MICIFDCGYDVGNYNRADQIESILKGAGFKTKTFVASKNQFPVSANDFDGFIITGSPKFHDDKDEWIGRLRGFIKAQTIKPVLGICLGHQLISIIQGGKVERIPQGRSFGYKEVVLTDAGKRSPLFKGIPSPMLTFFSHRDIITILQRGAILLAKDRQGAQAFQHGNYYGVQFHPDFSWPIAQYFAEKRGMDPGYPGDEKVAESWNLNKRILINFANIVNNSII